MPDRFALLVALTCIAPLIASAAATNVGIRVFGRLPDGREARIYTLKSPAGFQADICDYGGLIVRLLTPDRSGQLGDVVLGFDDLDVYVQRAQYVGALIGRVANRVGGAKFELDGRTCTLTTNSGPSDPPCQLHGGVRGFNRVLWSAQPASREGLPALRLSYSSADGEEGYPGNLQVEVLYSLTADQGLRIDYTATTDKPTPFNPACHAFFNLAGEGKGTILDHIVTIHARRYTPVNAGLVPTGEIAPVAGTPLDFTAPQRIGGLITNSFLAGRGYDHNYALDSTNGTLALAATVHEPVSGRVMETLTTEPGLQFFTANLFNGQLTGKSGQPYPRHAGFCLETQHFPDSVNQPKFPSTILRPGATFRSTTIYRFSAK